MRVSLALASLIRMKFRLLFLALTLPLLLALPASALAHPSPRLWLPPSLPKTTPSPSASEGLFAWPVIGPIVRSFDPPPQPWLPGHRGVDIEAPESSLVRAASGGVVWFAGVVASRPVVSIAHPNGTRTTYEPVRALVSAGDPVSAGDVIGVLLAGHAGCARACLHWGLRQGETYLDPLSLLGLGRVRLLPASPSVRAI